LNLSPSSLQNSYHYFLDILSWITDLLFFTSTKLTTFFSGQAVTVSRWRLLEELEDIPMSYQKMRIFLFIINIEKQMYYCLTLKKKVSFVEVKNSCCLWFWSGCFFLKSSQGIYCLAFCMLIR
jgi:hypothetical protein